MSDFVDDDIREEDTLIPFVASLDGDDADPAEIDKEDEEDPEEDRDLSI